MLGLRESTTELVNIRHVALFRLSMLLLQLNVLLHRSQQLGVHDLLVLVQRRSVLQVHSPFASRLGSLSGSASLTF